MECYEKASKMGLPKGNFYIYFCILSFISLAISNLAFCIENGIGCQKDIPKAMELYEKSAKLGYASGNKLILSHLIFIVKIIKSFNFVK